jgi:hypothetical protein
LTGEKNDQNNDDYLRSEMESAIVIRKEEESKY